MKNNKDKIYRLIRETNKLHGLSRFNQPTKCIEKIDSYSKIIFEGEKWSFSSLILSMKRSGDNETDCYLLKQHSLPLSS